MASSFLDVCRFNPTAGSTTDWTYSSAVTGYQSPTAAGAVNGAIYSYRAESNDLLQWEVGYGAYNSSTGVFARTTVLFNSAGTTAKINFATVPQVAIVALAEDLPSLGSSNSFAGAQTVTNATDATSAAAGGAFTIAGGLAVAKRLFVGGAATIAGAFKVADTTASTSTTTGSGVFGGGIGVAGASNFGDKVFSPQFWSVGANTWTSSGLNIYTSVTGGGPAGAIANSHATAGDAGLVIAVGPSGTGDTTSSFQVFENSGFTTVYGNIQRNGAGVSYLSASDERLKTRFDEADVSWLDAIDRIWVGDFEWIESPGVVYFGTRAQQLYKHFPQAVSRPADPEGLWTVDPAKLAPLALLGVKDLRERVAALEQRLDKFERSRNGD